MECGQHACISLWHCNILGEDIIQSIIMGGTMTTKDAEIVEQALTR